jgi:hypothetical protein
MFAPAAFDNRLLLELALEVGEALTHLHGRRQT